jgi:hypothetical protein
MYNGHKEIEGMAVRVSMTAMLTTPFLSQSKFLMAVASAGIACRMCDNGDVEVHGEFTQDLLKEEFISQKVADHFEKTGVETIQFVDDLWRR